MLIPQRILNLNLILTKIRGRTATVCTYFTNELCYIHSQNVSEIKLRKLNEMSQTT